MNGAPQELSTYDAAGRLETILFAYGESGSLEYDLRSRLAAESLSLPAQGVVRRLDYTYELPRRRLVVAAKGRSESMRVTRRQELWHNAVVAATAVIIAIASAILHWQYLNEFVFFKWMAALLLVQSLLFVWRFARALRNRSDSVETVKGDSLRLRRYVHIVFALGLIGMAVLAIWVGRQGEASWQWFAPLGLSCGLAALVVAFGIVRMLGDSESKP